MNGRKRFYREVSVDFLTPLEGEGRAGGYQVLLDGKPIRTPSGAVSILPTTSLADAVAEEWRAQGDKIRPATMILTKLANTAIDRVAPNRQAVIAQILAFGKSDSLCYRAEAPEALVGRQVAAWDPLLEWARVRYGAELHVATGIGPIEQSPEALQALERAIAGHGDFALAGLHGAATLLGSVIVALALSEGRLDAGEAFAAAYLDEIYQAEKWGRDQEADRRLRNKAAELTEIARFLRILRG